MAAFPPRTAPNPDCAPFMKLIWLTSSLSAACSNTTSKQPVNCIYIPKRKRR
ncbi:uncharacterized protein EI97DRAFT_432901 [Westerdykella ornata]|uniref:Uncharacterized protein n=1 Tax=Westerdykella ornata TaxID=318751 RepID=A0A6A6JLX6_WESOR|nr:uncharacterized protein EI97DRAFT_432901 [Westerdykella ornata]KAF2276656.1 hypothetical protein EI97DRAFT_432901 [Westerdykella ornata]